VAIIFAILSNCTTRPAYIFHLKSFYLRHDEVRFSKVLTHHLNPLFKRHLLITAGNSLSFIK